MARCRKEKFRLFAHQCSGRAPVFCSPRMRSLKDGDAPKTARLPYKLIRRESTGPVTPVTAPIQRNG
jgi:hypothetical protein